ncbi:tumor necrosis factor ligand superfamily member 9 [Panthera pardus]|uniref:Tumor necrosis factor ligand superfamily member 9 n=1 Tax=Panthera pardus TaxID=9691 RepID=A0A9V1EQP1_PANPR|nr:tumor necrosis factor ligand superfamily member 9 [Panthera pardus]XP_042783340.1 tumor necrosis factor ligand superfamily member 9 [Panthera leo]
MCPRADAVPDPEAQRPPAPPGPACRPLPWALSVALLLLLLAGTCAACWLSAWVAPAASAAPGPSLPRVPEQPPDARARLPDSPQAVFAQLVAQDVQLTEGPLRWYSDPALAGVFLGPGLSYDQHSRELMVAEPGVYYVFLHLKLQRVVSSFGSGSVSVALHLQPLGAGAAALALTLDLPPPSSKAPDSASGFRSSLLHLGPGQRLGVHLRAEAGAHPAWQLAQGATILGLFRVATKVPAGLSLPPWPIDTGPGYPPPDRE